MPFLRYMRIKQVLDFKIDFKVNLKSENEDTWNSLILQKQI